MVTKSLRLQAVILGEKKKQGNRALELFAVTRSWFRDLLARFCRRKHLNIFRSRFHSRMHLSSVFWATPTVTLKYIWRKRKCPEVDYTSEFLAKIKVFCLKYNVVFY